MLDSESPVYSDFSVDGETSGDIYSASGVGMLVNMEDGGVDSQEEDGDTVLCLHGNCCQDSSSVAT